MAGGTLLYNGSLAAGAGTISVASGGTLGGTGPIASVVTVASGGTLSPGVSVGALTASSSVTVGSGANLAITIDDTQSPNCGKLVAGGTLTISGSTLTISANGTPSQPFYVIATYSALTGTFAATNGIPAATPSIMLSTPAPPLPS